MIVLTDKRSALELDLITWDGDAYISAHVDSRGFSGSTDLHVSGDNFKKFCSDLLALQSNLRGEAQLTAVDPTELNVCIRPFDKLGHISVSGKLGNQIYTDHAMNWHSVEFGFEVDPQQLDLAIKVAWVQEHAD